MGQQPKREIPLARAMRPSSLESVLPWKYDSGIFS